jgi:hypothetical protein
MLDKNVKQEKKNFISENVKKKVIRDQSKKKIENKALKMGDQGTKDSHEH